MLPRAASPGPPTLADKGYTEASIGIKIPANNPTPTPTPDSAGQLITSMRTPAERANTPIKHHRDPQTHPPPTPEPPPSPPQPWSSSPSTKTSGKKTHRDQEGGVLDLEYVVSLGLGEFFFP